MKLNQILAVEKGIKNSTKEKITALHHSSTHAPSYEGLEKTYRSLDEEGAKLPSESQKIQQRAPQVLACASSSWTELFNITYAKDVANCEAKADVKVGDTVVLSAVPVTYLLFLEKQLQDVVTFISKMPVLDPAEKWEWDASNTAFATSPVETHRSKKVTKPVVLYEATPEHPAQVKESSEDVVVGYWSKIRYSAALSQEQKESYLTSATKLLQSVKIAREEANSSVATRNSNVGESVFSYIFPG